jgi:hypothetical protein
MQHHQPRERIKGMLRCSFRVLMIAGGALLVSACAVPTPTKTPTKTTPAPTGRAKLLCPKQQPAPPIIDGQRLEHLLPSYWLQQVAGRNATLLTATEIAAHNERIRKQADPSAPVARVDLVAAELVFPRRAIEKDLTKLAEAAQKGKRYLLGGNPIAPLLKEIFGQLGATKRCDEFRIVHQPTPLRCYPTSLGVFDAPDDTVFDLAQCAQLRFGELVRVLAKGPRFYYVRSAHGAGWAVAARLSVPLKRSEVERYQKPARFVVVKSDKVGIFSAPTGGQMLGVAQLGARFEWVKPAEQGLFAVRVPSRNGLKVGYIRAGHALTVGFSDLTKSAFYRRAFSLLDSPYGWGGLGNHRDCSRILMDLFASFGLEIPRNSRQQATSGIRRIDVSKLSDDKKREAIVKAARDSLVLLYLPGHIMLYVGHEGQRLFALHQFSGYLTRCSSGGETMQRVNRATVTHLELGRGSSRKAFIERITQLVLFGPREMTPR